MAEFDIKMFNAFSDRFGEKEAIREFGRPLKEKSTPRPRSGPQNKEKLKQQRSLAAAENRILQLPGERPATKADTTLVRKKNPKFFDGPDGKVQDPIKEIAFLGSQIEKEIARVDSVEDMSPAARSYVDSLARKREGLMKNLKPTKSKAEDVPGTKFNLVIRGRNENKEAKKKKFLEGLPR